MVIYEDQNVNVKYDETVPCVIWTPLKFMKDENWRNPFIKGVDFFAEQIEKTPNLIWLCDARKLISVPLDDLRWLDKNLNDRLFMYGLTKVVFVMPEDIFGEMAVKFYVDFTNARTNNKLEIKIFTTSSEAIQYINATNLVEVEELQLEDCN